MSMATNRTFNFRFQKTDFSFTLNEDAGELSAFPSFLEKVSSAAVEASASSLLNKGNIYLTSDGKSTIDGFDQLPDDLTTVIQVGLIINPPGPNPLPFIGNIYELIPDPFEDGYYCSLVGQKRLYKQYGPVFKLRIQGFNVISSNIPEVIEVLSKESEYFTKKIVGFANHIKELGGQGLFTTDTEELDWSLAHVLLMPAFSPKAMKAYAGEMGHIGSKISKIFDGYAREPKIENQIVEITDWMTNVTFETIGKIGFGFDFGLVDHRDAPVHPFIAAMGFCLNEIFERAFRLYVVTLLSFASNKKFNKSLDLMRETVNEVIQARKTSPHAKDANRDLLGFMLNARDENTNLSLSDDIIRDEVITFLIAGHETTSITLSWLLYELDQHPDVQDKVLKEIVTIFGDQYLESNEIPSISQISQLQYLEQCLKEVLRKYPPVKGIQKYCKKDCVLPGGFLIKKGEIATISIYQMHHNPHIFPDPENFDPDRWSPGKESERSTYSWLPFSIGARGCIGRQFAMQEAKVIASMILRKFKFVTVTENVHYNPTALTLRPQELKMRIFSRENLPVIDQTQILKKVLADPVEIPVALSASKIPLPPIEILYGSNTGTAQDYATIVSTAAKNLGFSDISLSTLDNWKGFQKAIDGTFKEKTHVIIVTATYNGQPPENADNFSKALQKIQASALKTESVPLDGLSYTVFGCGNKQWRTYQSFPKSIDTAFDSLGAKKIFHRGEGNADDDIETDFQKWFNELVAFLSSQFGIEISAPSRLTGTPESITEGLDVKIIPIDSFDKISENINESASQVVLLESRELQNISESGRSTRHIKFQLHESETYIPGDHLEVFPRNKKELVEQFASRAGLILDSSFEIKHISSTSQIGSRSLARTITGPCTIRSALTNYADLLGPPSRTVLWALSDILHKDGIHEQLEHKFRTLSNPGSKSEYVEFVAKHRTILDVLRAYPEITKFPLAEFLCGVQVMAPRRYSISSSPNAVEAGVATVTVGIVQDVVPGSDNVYPGLCSEYLSLLQPNQKVQAAVRPCKDKAFRTPVEPDVPVVMIAAGTGVSPFLGFLQERKSAGFKSKEKGGVSSTVLYFGCRNEDDYIYREEIEQFVSEGTLDVIEVAYSRPKTNVSKKYVQHLLLDNASKIWKTLVQENGKIFICGSASGMANDVLRTFESISQQLGGIEQQEAKNFVEKLQKDEKIVLDVWG